MRGKSSEIESKKSFAAAIKIITVTKICKYRSLISRDNRAPTNPPKKEPIAKNPAWVKSGCPSILWAITPDNDENNKINCEVGAAFFIAIPIPITIKGTKIIPPPIPKNADIIPAKKLVPTAKIIICVDSVFSLVSIFFLRKI